MNVVCSVYALLLCTPRKGKVGAPTSLHCRTQARSNNGCTHVDDNVFKALLVDQ